MEFALRIYWGREEGWEYQDFENLPVPDPCVVVIHLPPELGGQEEADLLQQLWWLIAEIGGEPTQAGEGSWKSFSLSEAYWLHALVSDGVHAVGLDEETLQSVRKSDRAWVLPILSESMRPFASTLLEPALKIYNAAFWRKSIREMAQVVLARAGVTSLDRRVFISYRQSEALLIADQIYDELVRRNFQVFLDRVSIDPGVDFQAKLFEHLADKSMVVMLLSKSFSASPWTKKEIEFARERRLSLIVLRLPEAANDKLGGQLTHAGEVLELLEADLEWVQVEGQAEVQPRLREAQLKKAVEEITSQHDKELIARLRDLRDRVLDAARDQPGIKCTTSKNGSAVLLEMTTAQGVARRYSLHPSAYPPGVPEMFAASTRLADVADKRVVVGHTGNLLPLRANHLEWVVNGRNVLYHDVMTLNSLLDRIATGEL